MGTKMIHGLIWSVYVSLLLLVASGYILDLGFREFLIQYSTDAGVIIACTLIVPVVASFGLLFKDV